MDGWRLMDGWVVVCLDEDTVNITPLSFDNELLCSHYNWIYTIILFIV